MRLLFAWIGLLLAGLMAGCGSPAAGPGDASLETAPRTTEKTALPETPNEPAPAPLPPAPVPDKTIYAKSFINKPAPKFVVEQWLSPKVPDREGKMVLIDFWATWCSPCLKAIPELNQLHRKYKDRLVVIGVSDETSEKVKALETPRIDYALAIDPQRRMYGELRIQGIPHVIIVDPTGIVRWEGYPLQKGHELTEEVVDDLLDTYVP